MMSVLFSLGWGTEVQQHGGLPLDMGLDGVCQSHFPIVSLHRGNGNFDQNDNHLDGSTNFFGIVTPIVVLPLESSMAWLWSAGQLNCTQCKHDLQTIHFEKCPHGKLSSQKTCWTGRTENLKELDLHVLTLGSSLVTVIHSLSLALPSALDSELTRDASVFSDANAEVSAVGMEFQWTPIPASDTFLPSLHIRAASQASKLYCNTGINHHLFS